MTPLDLHRCSYCDAPSVDAQVAGDGKVVFVCGIHVDHTGPVDALLDRAELAKEMALLRMREASEARRTLIETVRRFQWMAQALVRMTEAAEKGGSSLDHLIRLRNSTRR